MDARTRPFKASPVLTQATNATEAMQPRWQIAANQDKRESGKPGVRQPTHWPKWLDRWRRARRDARLWHAHLHGPTPDQRECSSPLRRVPAWRSPGIVHSRCRRPASRRVRPLSTHPDGRRHGFRDRSLGCRCRRTRDSSAALKTRCETRITENGNENNSCSTPFDRQGYAGAREPSFHGKTCNFNHLAERFP